MERSAKSPLPTFPATRRAVIQDKEGKPKLAEIPIPSLTPGTILVKPSAVALDPSDYKFGAAFPTPGSVIGSNFAGTVVTVAPCTQTHLVPGDTIAGGVHGSNPESPEDGAFATYIRTPASMAMKFTPTKELSMEQAATMATALASCTLAFWSGDALDLLPSTPEQPRESPLPILVYGGSTATGTIAIQLLRLSGFNPITTCSPHNFELVRSRGAGAVFDYADSNTPAAIKKYTGGQLKHVLDSIADTQSVETCFEAIARTGGQYISLERVPDILLAKRRAVRTGFIMAFEVYGEEVRLPGGYGRPADSTKKRLGERFFAVFQRLLNEGKLVPHPTQRVDGGLEGLIEGLQTLKSGSLSGVKLTALL
ncbi:MAG: hypothetical protein L6R42_000091 [Xanthoria sp. 1 TBL-2021]|nr:MAG: hypothetical protein L6R42_000091 [Xanthoria sp. 1 TBL-2021]